MGFGANSSQILQGKPIVAQKLPQSHHTGPAGIFQDIPLHLQPSQKPGRRQPESF